MLQTAALNRRIVLNARPHGAPSAADFRLESGPVPVPGQRQLLLRTLYLSLDAGLRSRLDAGPSSSAPIALGQVMAGATVSRVEASGHADFRVGQLVQGHCGWQDYALSDGTGLRALYPEDPHPSRALGVLGLPGYTAYRALLDIGRPQAGETVVVAAASGAVGAVVGQIAKIRGCWVVGVVAGPDQCRHVIDELGFDFCVDPLAGDLPGHLAAACPRGIDVYVESVGAAVFDAVLPLLNAHARVPVCGLVADGRHPGLPAGPDRLGPLLATLLRQRIRLQGFSMLDDDPAGWQAFAGAMGEWVRQDRVRLHEHTVFGLQNAPEAFIGLLSGRTFGQPLVQLAHE